MFCSTSCMNNFYSKALNMNEILCDDVKLLSVISAAYGGIKEFKDFMSNSDSKQFDQTIFDFDLSDPQDPNYNKNRISCLLSLSRKYSYSIDEKTCSIKKYVSKKTADHILGILMANLPRMHSVCPVCPYEEANISLFVSILKHSCVPNVFKCNIGNKIATIVFRPIKKERKFFTVTCKYLFYITIY